jgi:CheY-like chemotaxis protein
MKILIAEDESKIRLALKIILEHRGHQVIATADGEECANVYRNDFLARPKQEILSPEDERGKPFDAVILDYRMPRKHGTEVAEEILKLNPNQRIIFASAYAVSLVQSLSLNVKDNKNVQWLQKPFGLDLLADMVEDSSFEMRLV